MNSASVANAAAIAALAERLAGGSIGAAGEKVRDLARQRLADSMVCLLAGTTTIEGGALRDTVSRLGMGAPASLSDLITYMVGSTRATEADDIHLASCTTVGSVIVPVCLAVAATHPGITGGRLVEATIAGYQAMIALGTAIDGANRVYSGVWPTILSAPIGAAAATAVALGLDYRRTRNALGISLSRSIGLVGRYTTDRTAHWFTLGRAAAEGYAAAVAAACGLEGDPGLLDQRFERATGTTLTEQPFREETQWFVTEVDTKPYRAQRQAVSGVEAFRAALGGRDWRDCRSITIYAPRQYASAIDLGTPPIRRNTPGVQYMIALATQYENSLFDVNRTPVKDTEDVRLLMGRIRVQDDDRLSGLYPLVYGARAEITWRDGTSSCEEILDPPGSAQNPLTWDKLRAKSEHIIDVGNVIHKCNSAGVPVDGGWTETMFDALRCLDGDGMVPRPLLQTVHSLRAGAMSSPPAPVAVI